MCINKNTLPDGTEIACRECWQCRENKSNDWVGRCIAESQTSKACHFVTLTYGRNQYDEVLHERAAYLTYSDVQKYFKLLRRNGYPMRYLCVGEYGSEKGRAHWHIVIFWQDKIPELELNKRINEKHWPHGYSQYEELNRKNIKYCVKYIHKDDEKPEKQSRIMMSKKPPLGDAYFRDLAKKYVKAGLAPQDGFYNFPDMPKTKHMMTAVTAKNFCRYFLDEWWRCYGDHPPASEFIETFEDGQVNMLEDLTNRIEQHPDDKVPLKLPNGTKPRWSPDFGCFVCQLDIGDGLKRTYYYIERQEALNKWQTNVPELGIDVFPKNMDRDAPFTRYEKQDKEKNL